MPRYTESIYVYGTAMGIWSHQPIVYTGYIIANIYRKCTFVYKYMFMQTVYMELRRAPVSLKRGLRRVHNDKETQTVYICGTVTCT